jgi:hypothetical protein
MTKYHRDRTSIEHKINRLINDERIHFEHRRSSDNKRKHC